MSKRFFRRECQRREHDSGLEQPQYIGDDDKCRTGIGKNREPDVDAPVEIGQRKCRSAEVQINGGQSGRSRGVRLDGRNDAHHGQRSVRHDQKSVRHDAQRGGGQKNGARHGGLTNGDPS